MNAEQMLAMATAFAAQHVTGVTGSGPTTKRHRGSGASLRAPEALSASDVEFARTWALSSGMAAALPADAAGALPARVPIVLPDGEVSRSDPQTLNGNALLAAEATCAAELAVLLGITRRRVERLAALDRLRDSVAQVEALGDGSGTA